MGRLVNLSLSLGLIRSRRCKTISGKRKRNRKQKSKGIGGDLGANSNDNGGFDKLNDDVLVKIISLLSLEEAARTSVLSRRWRYLWRFGYGTLLFDRANAATGNVMRREKFESWVNTVLSLHQGRHIEGLVVNLQAREESKGDHHMFGSFDSWVQFAVEKDVQRFELNLSFGDEYKFPNVERLISHSHGLTYPFSCLRTLRLAHVKIKDELVHYFLASCRNLQVLCIHYSDFTKNLQVVDPPSLKVLEITGCYYIKNLEISSDNLISLTYEGKKNSLLLKKIPNLCELNLSGDMCVFFVCEPHQYSIYAAQLEKLVLDFQLPTSNGQLFAPQDLPQLCSLKRLEVRVFTTVGRSLFFFTSLIKTSPKLREFRIEMSYSVIVGSLPDEEMPFPEISKAEAVKFSHRDLKVVEMAGYIGCSSEKKLLLKLFKTCPSIERVVIDTESDYYTDPDLPICLTLLEESSVSCQQIGATTRQESKERAVRLLSEFPKPIEFTVT